jgi:hypothetical protein
VHRQPDFLPYGTLLHRLQYVCCRLCFLYIALRIGISRLCIRDIGVEVYIAGTITRDGFLGDNFSDVCIWIQGSVFTAIPGRKATNVNVCRGEEGTEVCPLFVLAGFSIGTG